MQSKRMAKSAVAMSKALLHVILKWEKDERKIVGLPKIETKTSNERI
jgi:hypothetical protein